MIKVLLVDDHQIFREGIKSLLSARNDIKVVGEAEDGLEAIQKAKELKPDIVVMDISLKELNGIEATGKIVATMPKIQVIMLSMHSNLRYVKNALKAGARGYLPKDCAYKELVDAIHKVIKGHKYLSQPIANLIADDYIEGVVTKSNLDDLTPTERQILQLLAIGKDTNDITELLNLSKKTILSYRHTLMKKLDLHNLSEIIYFALKEGIIEPPKQEE
jgi:two-component system, NarL family, response regulator NreC